MHRVTGKPVAIVRVFYPPQYKEWEVVVSKYESIEVIHIAESSKAPCTPFRDWKAQDIIKFQPRVYLQGINVDRITAEEFAEPIGSSSKPVKKAKIL